MFNRFKHDMNRKIENPYQYQKDGKTYLDIGRVVTDMRKEYWKRRYNNVMDISKVKKLIGKHKGIKVGIYKTTESDEFTGAPEGTTIVDLRYTTSDGIKAVLSWAFSIADRFGNCPSIQFMHALINGTGEEYVASVIKWSIGNIKKETTGEKRK